MPSSRTGAPSRTPQRSGAAPRGGGQGRVCDPALDGRLRVNKARGVSKGTTKKDATVAPGGQGRVKDPSRDRRLKKNQPQR